MLMHIAPLLALTPEIKQELYPILLFLGMFAVVFGLGGTLVRRCGQREHIHLPRKPGSMLDEILSEKWEDEQEDERENADEQHTQEKE